MKRKPRSQRINRMIAIVQSIVLRSSFLCYLGPAGLVLASTLISSILWHGMSFSDTHIRIRSSGKCTYGLCGLICVLFSGPQSVIRPATA
jgi:hypothetical protein